MTVSSSTLRPPVALIENMAWCWWTRPRATRIGGKLFVGAIEAGGGIVAAMIDLATGAMQRTTLAQFEDDDHNNPALVAEAGRPLICFYSRHDAPEGLRYRVSEGALDPSAWGDERLLTFGGSTTYAQVHNSGGELHLFTRVDETRWGWRLSSDWATSWTPARDFLAFDTDQQVYMATALLADGRTLRVAVSGHPKEYEQRPLHDVWACQIDLLTGIVSTSTGTVLGNLRTGEDMPLRQSQLDLVQRTTSDRTVNLFDVSSGPVFEISFVSKIKDDRSTRDTRYHVASWREGAWRTETLVGAGSKFGYIDAGFYVGGTAFAEHSTGGEVFLSREEAGLWHLQRWTRSDDGRWAGADLVTPGTTRIVRPWVIAPPTAAHGVLALALEHYPDDDYMDTRSSLVVAPLKSPS